MSKKLYMSKKKSNPNIIVTSSWRLPKKLKDLAKKKSKATGVSMSFVIRKALEEFVSENPKLVKRQRHGEDGTCETGDCAPKPNGV